MDDEFLQEIQKQFKKIVEKTADKIGIAGEHYKFKLSCDVLNENLEKYKEYILYEEEHEGFCSFCQTKTYYYDKKRWFHLCAECFSKLENKK